MIYEHLFDIVLTDLQQSTRRSDYVCLPKVLFPDSDAGVDRIDGFSVGSAAGVKTEEVSTEAVPIKMLILPKFEIDQIFRAMMMPACTSRLFSSANLPFP